MFIKSVDFKYYILLETILEEIDLDIVYCDSDFRLHEEHKKYLVNFIVEEYIRTTAHELARKLALNEQKEMLRHKLTKTVQFLGQ